MTRLSFAIPSKGRLKEQSEKWLAESGFRLRQQGGGRGYTAALKGLPEIDVMLLSAREIAEGLISGDLHVGITGEDLIHDLSSNVERDVHRFRQLGFGGADVVVAVPAAWFDVVSMADLEAAAALFREKHGRQMRVATKYMNLTRRFFAERAVGEYRIIESAGATEAAPAAGSAELIVDITSTGSTLKANQLKLLSDGTLLKSEAALFGSKQAPWSESVHAHLKVLLSGMEATAAGRALRKLSATVPLTPDLIAQFDLTPFETHAALCDQERAGEVARNLAIALGSAVIVSRIEQVYQPQSDGHALFVKNMS